MKRSNKKPSVLHVLTIIASCIILYVSGLITCVFICASTFSNINEEQLIEHGHEQGRRQILDSLNNVTDYGKNRDTRKNPFTIDSNGDFHATNAH